MCLLKQFEGSCLHRRDRNLRHGAFLAGKLWAPNGSTYFFELGICAGVAESEAACAMVFVSEWSSFRFGDLVDESIDDVIIVGSNA